MIRNTIFLLVFYFGLIFLLILFMPSLILPQYIVTLGGKFLGYWTGFCLKYIMGTKIEIKGIENIDKVVNINQKPIGRTPRSNPATYCGVYTEIRSLFSLLTESVIRGYKPGRFSFNVQGGRCEECKGGGLKLIVVLIILNIIIF